MKDNSLTATKKAGAATSSKTNRTLRDGKKTESVMDTAKTGLKADLSMKASTTKMYQKKKRK